MTFNKTKAHKKIKRLNDRVDKIEERDRKNKERW